MPFVAAQGLGFVFEVGVADDPADEDRDSDRNDHPQEQPCSDPPPHRTSMHNLEFVGLGNESYVVRLIGA